MISPLFPKTLLTLFFYFQCAIGISPSDDQSDLTSTIKDRLIASNSENVVDEHVQYKTPQPPQENVYLYESFDDVHRFKKIWHKSESTKGPKGEFNYDGTWDIVVTHQKIRGDYGLRMRSKSKHHAISRKLDQEFSFAGSPLIIQYDVQFRNGQECGGAYIKLLSAPSGNLSLVNDQSKYSIMFGPDKCGSDHRLHFIFSHINSKTGAIREIHWKDAHTLTNLADVFIDGKWHLFRLSINPTNRFEISLDKRIVAIGSLLTDFSPSVNPELEIDDPNDAKPEDWDEREKIPDPDAVKPDDWDNGEPKLIPDTKARKPKGWLEDEPLMVPDPNALKPEDWSDDENGSWNPPMIKNPRCVSAPGCGPWSPPLIDNPKYKGEWLPPLIPNLAYQGRWVPRKIPNPDYFEDKHPYNSIAPIDAVAFELWTLSDGIVFDNILITSDLAIADSIAMASYQIKKEINDLETDNWFKRMIKQTNKKPWLWAVYIVATAIPVIFFIGFCCVTPGSSSESSASSTNYSSATLSSIFEMPNPSTSSTSAKLIDNLHTHHLLTESCKIDHTDQYAFRYQNACINESDCSPESPESTELQSQFTSNSRYENTNNTGSSGYCSSYNVQHSHSSATQHSTNILTSSFNFNSCLEEIIPDEADEEQDDLKEAEMRRFEENEFHLMNGEFNYDENDGQLGSDSLSYLMADEKLNGDREICTHDVPIGLCNSYESSINDLINETDEIDQDESRPEDMEENRKLTGEIQVNDVMLNSSDNDNTYDNNDIVQVENEINSDLAQDSITTDNFTNDNIDVNISDEAETNVNESIDNFQSHDAIKLENSSVRRRRKGKGRRKDPPASRHQNDNEGISEPKGSTRQGNKSKNRRTKARRE